MRTIPRPQEAGPRCEVCGQEPAISFSWFTDRTRWGAPQSGTWRVTGYCTADTEQYFVRFHTGRHGFLDSQAAQANWVLHLAGKRWFNRTDFVAMLTRFDRARAAATRGAVA